MNSEDPRQGTGAYGGNGAYEGTGGYVANGGYGTQVPVAPARSSSHRGAWIGAGATLVAAVIGVVGTYLVSSNNSNANPTPPAAQGPAAGASSQTPESQSPESQASESQDPATPATTPPAAPSTAPSTAPPAKPAGTPEWQGALAITYTEDKDLDSAPPAESEINEENDFSVYPFGTTHMLRPENGVKALVWKDSTKAPEFADCAGVVDTLGASNDLKMKTGLVVCARTNDGRLARLTVKELTGQGSDTSGVFDVVVWSR